MYQRLILRAARINGVVLILSSTLLAGVCLHCMIAPPSPEAMLGGAFAMPFFAAFAALQYLATLRRRSRAAFNSALILFGAAGLALFTLVAHGLQMVFGGSPPDGPNVLIAAIFLAVTAYLFLSARLNLRWAGELEEKGP